MSLNTNLMPMAIADNVLVLINVCDGTAWVMRHIMDHVVVLCPNDVAMAIAHHMIVVFDVLSTENSL